VVTVTNVNIKVDNTLKLDTENILAESGLTLSTATTMFYKLIVKHGSVPFSFEHSAKSVEVQEQNKYETLSKYFGIAQNENFDFCGKDDKEILAEALTVKYENLA
jgi:addiction module RelB/DinJ family antitoxin